MSDTILGEPRMTVNDDAYIALLKHTPFETSEWDPSVRQVGWLTFPRESRSSDGRLRRLATVRIPVYLAEGQQHANA